MEYELFKKEFDTQLKVINITLDDNQIQQFYIYYNNLSEWNKVMNLTAITEPNEVILKHFIDSIILTKYINFDTVDSLIDIGTGAGFPGLPLKILYPNIKVVLLDSLNKRIKFLNDTILKCELNNIDCIHGRAEEFANKKEYREKYDIVVSRAVANLTTLSEYCIPYTSIKGKFIAYKGSKMNEELDDARFAINLLGGKVDNIFEFELPNGEIGRAHV